MPIPAPDHDFVGARPRRCPDCHAVAVPEYGDRGIFFRCAWCDGPANGRVAWSGTCPVCRCSPLTGKPTGGMECTLCAATFPPPPERGAVADLPTEASHPRWEDDARLADAWAVYARPGGLVEAWGAPGPLEREKAKRGGGAAFWAKPGKLGRQDDLLEASRHADAEQVLGLADALRALSDVALRSGRKLVPAKTRGRAVRDLLLQHTADVACQPMSEARPSADLDPQPWFLKALGVLLANALLARGKDAWALLRAHRGPSAEVPDGPIEPVATRLPRTTPFTGYHHAIAVAFTGEATLGGRGMAPGGAQAVHALPQGVVFGKMSVHPSRSGSSRAQGEDEVGSRAFLVSALEDQGLDALDLTLLRLVDLGVDRGAARRTRSGALEEAIEALNPAEAVAWLRARGQVVTEHEVKRRLQHAREAVTRALRAREQIPERKPKRVARPPVAPIEIPRVG